MVSLFTGGKLKSDATVEFDTTTTSVGDSIVKGLNSVETRASSVTVAPRTEAGDTATLTFDTGDLNLTAGATLSIDAPFGGQNDHIHVTNATQLGGSLALNLGFIPAAWSVSGATGDWIHVLSSGTSLTNTIAANLPPVPNGRWRVIYDRDDVTPDPVLKKKHPSFINQPWLGNGTRDVVLVVLAHPDDLTYGQYTLDFEGETTKVTMGYSNVPESGYQPEDYHGVSLHLDPAAVYVITVDYDLSTWDSYIQPGGGPGRGYWDSFSISVTDVPYPQLELNDPLPLPFVWGGTRWGDGILEGTTGTVTITVPGNLEEDRYLNLTLDTFTPPSLDGLYPSWGTFTVTTPLPRAGGGGGGGGAGAGGGGFLAGGGEFGMLSSSSGNRTGTRSRYWDVSSDEGLNSRSSWSNGSNSPANWGIVGLFFPLHAEIEDPVHTENKLEAMVENNIAVAPIRASIDASVMRHEATSLAEISLVSPSEVLARDSMFEEFSEVFDWWNLQEPQVS